MFGTSVNQYILISCKFGGKQTYPPQAQSWCWTEEMTVNATLSMVSPTEVLERHSQGDRLHLIDVRTPAEFDVLHAAGAELLPLDQLGAAAIDSPLDLNKHGVGKKEPLYLLCHSGARASQAAEKLMSRGYWNVHVVQGGTERWAQLGLPVVRGKGAVSGVMPIERQVQVLVGGLVMLKVLFGFAISPIFFALLALVGAGLVFAGVTQNCALARLLARMPWNQRQTFQVRQPA